MGSSSGKGGGQTTRVTKYAATVVYALCWGKVDAFRAFRIGDRLAVGTNIEGPRTMNISRPDLHGGLKKEGGVEGSVIFMDGNKKQTLPARLCQRLFKHGRTHDVPGYRGVCCVALTGYWTGDSEYPAADGSDLNYSEGTSLEDAINGHWRHVPPGTASFYLGANNPYLKDVSFDLLRASDDWFPERALVYREAADRASYEAGTAISDIRGYADSNLIHAMFEMITNDQWGAGVPPSALHDASWRAAATQAYADKLGGSFAWSSPKPVKNLIADASDHVRCMFYRDPTTLKLGITLIRGDYEESELPVFDADNSELVSSSMTSPSGVANEITVEWTDPVAEEGVSVTAQNLASIRRTGEVEPEKRSYSFFRREDLAFSAATRDVLTSSKPLASATLELPPGNEEIKTGDVVMVNYPDDDLDNIPCRVMKVTKGTKTYSSRQIEVLQDVFSLPGFQEAEREAVTSEPETVQPFSSVVGAAAPNYLRLRAGMDDDGEEVVMVMASHNQSGVYAASLLENVPGPVTTESTEVGEVAIVPKGALPAMLPFATETVDFDLGVLSEGAPLTEGDFVAFGDTEADTELALVTSVGAGGVTLRRGVMDTCPKKHPAGTTVRVLSVGSRYVQSSPRVPGETVAMDVLPVSFFGTGAAGQPGNAYSYVVAARSQMPIRPANLTLAGNLEAGTDVSYLINGSVQVAWANRNRLLEDGTLLRWDESTIAPEAGQTTTIQVLQNDTVVAEHTGLTGTSFNLNTTGLTPGQATLRVFSVRGSHTSLQSVDRNVYIV